MRNILYIVLDFLVKFVEFIPNKIMSNKWFHLAACFFGVLLLVIFGLFYYFVY